MPKSKISQSSSVPTSSSATNRTPVKINSEGTPKWYVAIMLGLLVIGLLWLVVNYLAGQDIPLSLIHISEPTRQCCTSRMPSSA